MENPKERKEVFIKLMQVSAVIICYLSYYAEIVPQELEKLNNFHTLMVCSPSYVNEAPPKRLLFHLGHNSWSQYKSHQ